MKVVSPNTITIGSLAEIQCIFYSGDVVYVTWTKIKPNGTRIFVYEHNVCSKTSTGYNDLEDRSTLNLTLRHTDDVIFWRGKLATPERYDHQSYAVRSSVDVSKSTLATLSIYDANVNDEGQYECAVKTEYASLVWASSALRIYGKNNYVVLLYYVILY